MSERGGQLAQGHLYKYRLSLRLRTSGKHRTVASTLDARTLLPKVGAALLVSPANLSELSKRHIETSWMCSLVQARMVPFPVEYLAQVPEVG